MDTTCDLMHSYFFTAGEDKQAYHEITNTS